MEMDNNKAVELVKQKEDEIDYESLFPTYMTYMQQLSDEQKKEYFMLSVFYRKLITNYFNHICLNKYEELIEKSGLSFKQTDEYDKDFYQYY